MIDGLKELGALGMKVPEQYGGLGLSQVYYNRALALAGSMHASLSTLLSAHQSIGVAEPLLLFGTEEQKQRWLPLVARDHISAFLLTEPDVGSDPARLGATAEPAERRLPAQRRQAVGDQRRDRRHRRGHGQGARTTGITAFVLPYDTEGVTVEHRNAFMGLRGIENSVTRLEDVFVPSENVIAGEGKGLKVALTTLNTGRLALPAICVGTSKWATKVAREWSRRARPVGPAGRQARRGRAEGRVHRRQRVRARGDARRRLRMADDKRNDIRIEAAIAKLYASELGWQVVDELMQVRGGRGYETAESLKARGERPVPVEQAMRDMRINRIFEGSTEIMHLLIAREAVDQHLQVAGELLEGDGDLKAKARSAVAGRRVLRALAAEAGGRRGHQAERVRRVRRAGRRTCASSSARRAGSRARRSTRWAAGRRSSRSARPCSAGSSTSAPSCSRSPPPSSTPTRCGASSPPRAAEATELADLFCRQARRRVDALFDRLFDNDDTDAYALAQGVLGGRFTGSRKGSSTRRASSAGTLTPGRTPCGCRGPAAGSGWGRCSR